MHNEKAIDNLESPYLLVSWSKQKPQIQKFTIAEVKITLYDSSPGANKHCGIRAGMQ